MIGKTDTHILMRRASVVFLVLIGAFFLSTGSSLYLGWKSGELNARVLSPLKESFAFVGTLLTEASKESNIPKASSVSTVTNVNINTTTTDSQGKTYQYVYPSPTAQPQSSGTDNSNDWWKEVDAKNQANIDSSNAWFQQAKQKQQSDFEAAKAQQQIDMDAWAKQSQATIDQWKKNNGF